jgi:hypothetical protein
MIIHTNSRYDLNGRKRKPRKPKGEACVKYTPPKFKEYNPQSTYASERAAEAKRYPSRTTSPAEARGDRRESQQYTGDYVIGIATLHKSNAVPVTNQKYAQEISEMIK